MGVVAAPGAQPEYRKPIRKVVRYLSGVGGILMLRGGEYSRSIVFALKLLGRVGKSRAGRSVND